MISKLHRWELPNWAIPTLYAFVATLVGMTLPRFEGRLFHVYAAISPSTALAIDTSVATGMLAMTGVVFSLVFLMVQFSATAYSPRLVLWIARDRVIWHSLGIFTATFLYSIAAISGLDRNHSGKVPLISGWLVIVLLLASVGMFIALVERIAALQINRMLSFTGDRGRDVIGIMFSPFETPIAVVKPEEFERVPVTQTLVHIGRPLAIQGIDHSSLLRLALAADGIVVVVSSVGDTVVEGTVLIRVHGATTQIEEAALRKTLAMGRERTFDQDPKYAIRLLVDIAIRALSPAVNDPTTAVQALDQIEDLLLRLGRSRLQTGAARDAAGTLRLVIAEPTWEDFTLLAFDEIRHCGATSVQIMRRMRALISDLISLLPKERHPVLRRWQERLDSTIGRSFEDAEEKLEASREDRQGLGVPRRPAPEPATSGTTLSLGLTHTLTGDREH
jgi:uncharacterized membrane protein